MGPGPFPETTIPSLAHGLLVLAFRLDLSWVSQAVPDGIQCPTLQTRHGFGEKLAKQGADRRAEPLQCARHMNFDKPRGTPLQGRNHAD